MWISSASASSPAALVSSSIARSIWSGDEEVQADDVVRRLARLAPVDPASVAQLVALPGLADGQAEQQGDQRGEERAVVRHHWRRLARPLRHERVPASLGTQQQFDQLAHGAVAARRAAPRSPPACARRRRRRRAPPRTRRASAPAGRAGRLPCRRRRRRPASPCGESAGRRAPSARDSATSSRIRSSAARRSVTGDGRAESRPTRRPDALRPDQRRAVLDVEALRLAAVGVHQDLAVGEHAVHVEQQQLDRAPPGVERRGGRGGAGSLRTAPCATDRAGAARPRPPRRPSRR